jgi:glycosyltransferase involved in cell wall biosynthesis
LNILKLCYEYPPLGGGGGQVVFGLANQLARAGHHVDLLTMKYKKLPSLERAQNFSVHRVSCIRSSPVVCHMHEMMSYLCMALPRALRMVHENSYDLIHAHFIFPDGILAKLLSMTSGIPYVITAHGSDVPGYNPDRFVLSHKFLKPLWKSVLRSCSQVICLSQFIENLLSNVMPNAKTVIIPNGFQPGRFRSNRMKSDKILIVTRMFKRKGIQHFLKAIDGLAIDYKIHIVGDGPYLDNLKRQAKSISTPICFHGFIENGSELFKELMETSAIFVFPSESDNFPVVLLEAMDAGMAIITTKNTGCEEVVGHAAILTRPGDIGELRNALLRYMGDPVFRQKSGEMARNRLDENFSWPAVAERYVKIYKKVIQERQPKYIE